MIIIIKLIKSCMGTIGKILYLVVWILFSMQLLAQSSGSNYVRTRTMLDASTGRSMETICYVDGLGRPNQVNFKNQSGDGSKDIITVTQYDRCGRLWKEWMPMAQANNGNEVPDPSSLCGPDEGSPYSLTQYGFGFLNLVTRKYGAGERWHSSGKCAKIDYRLNSQEKKYCCRYYKVVDNTLILDGNYSNDVLRITEITDEDGHRTAEFRDSQDRIVLFRRYFAALDHDTYYVYDDCGNLRYVLPPKLSSESEPTADLIRAYAYIYTYNNRGQCLTKQLPGGILYEYIYDKCGRLRLMRDNNQRLSGFWTYYKYDSLGRLILMGTYKVKNSYNIMETSVASNSHYTESFSPGEPDLYTNNCFPKERSYMTILMANYYDNYDYQSSLPSLFDNCKNFVSGVSDPEFSCSKGFLTGRKVALLDDSGTYLWSSFRYGRNSLPVQSIEMNIAGGLEKEFICYSHTGKPLSRRLEHTSIYSAEIKEVYSYSYDHADRLTDTYYQYNNESRILMSRCEYDDVGRLSMKRLHRKNNGSFAENIRYGYNVRGWPVSINSESFCEQLFYEQSVDGTEGLYNGNISAMTVSYPNAITGAPATITGYRFTYDPVNRLTRADYGEGTDLSENLQRYSERFGYDSNSNVTYHLNYGYRPDGTYNQVQNLSLQYKGNRLSNVFNSATPSTAYGTQMYMPADPAHLINGNYLYDINGNLFQDYHRGIARINYNMLNLPQTVQMKNGNSISYTYDAMGRKHGRIVTTLKSAVDVPMGALYPVDASQIKSRKSNFYCGNLIYSGLTKIGLNTVFMEEGYRTSGYDFMYQVKDHLGNVRAEVDQFGCQYTMNYYPSGLKQDPNFLNSDYAFGNKELQTPHGLNLYDFEKRYYDMALNQWTTMDPLCEKYYWLSPYSYCGGNPINRFDPDGRDWVFISDEDGDRYEWRDAVSSSDDIYEDGVQYVGRHMTDILAFAGMEISSDAVTKTDTQIHTDKLGIDHEVDIYEIDGNYWGNEAFRFLANNTHVEWTLFNIGRTEMSVDGKSYLTTSKEYMNDYGNYEVAPYLNEESAVYPRLNVLSHIHNHPKGTLKASRDDTQNANNLRIRYPFVKCYIYNKLWGKLSY